jgi:hypothetical protein
MQQQLSFSFRRRLAPARVLPRLNEMRNVKTDFGEFIASLRKHRTSHLWFSGRTAINQLLTMFL